MLTPGSRSRRYALGCKDVRKYILRHGWMGPKGVNIIVAKFVVCCA
jgi:hypothetical protein